jgi:hypothetical protein
LAVNQHASVVGVREIIIAADPQTVWDVLTAIERWPSWNPDVETVSLHGPLAVGTQFRWRSGPQKLISTILRLERPWLFAWSGKTRGARTTKVWRLDPQDGRTIVRTEESWEGLLPRLLPRLMQRTLDSAIGAELGHLKAEAEARSAPGRVEPTQPPRRARAASAGPADLGGSEALPDGVAAQPVAGGELPWPKGWSRPSTVEALAWPMAVFGICALVAAPTVAAADLRLVQAIGFGLCLGGFGAAMLLVASVLLARRDAPPRLASVDDGGLTRRTGVALPYSRAQVVRLIAAGVGLCVSGVGLLLLGWWGLVLGAALLLVGVVAVVVPLQRCAGRGWQLVLLPEGVLYMQGPARALLGWRHILEVRAVRVFTRTWFSPPQKLGLVVDTWDMPLEPALVE